MKKIALFGGAFDPIHLGHLQLAKACQAALFFDEVRFIPCWQPVHKSACSASPWHRAAMVALAINAENNYFLDCREIFRQTPSYTIDTLRELREELPEDEFFWLVGEDALAGFPYWKEWRAIADYSHLVVVTREHPQEFDIARQQVIDHFQNTAHQVYFVTMPKAPFSSSDIRAALMDKHIPQKALTAEVAAYIEALRLYERIGSL